MMTGDPVIDVNIDSGSFGPAHSEADYPLDELSRWEIEENCGPQIPVELKIRSRSRRGTGR